jgi:hypothetical protein
MTRRAQVRHPSGPLRNYAGNFSRTDNRRGGLALARVEKQRRQWRSHELAAQVVTVVGGMGGLRRSYIQRK